MKRIQWPVVSSQWSVASNLRPLITDYCLLTTSYFLLLTAYFLTASPLAAQEPNQAGLVVRFDDGRSKSVCVSIDEEQISGYELLNRSGLGFTVEAQGIGALVCAIDGTGCPANDCLCQCRGGECVYWSYWWLREGEWRYASGGASLSRVEPGMVHGWSWGPSSVNEASPPPLTSFEEICGTAVEETTAVDNQSPPTNWLPYLIFMLIISGLLLRLARRSS